MSKYIRIRTKDGYIVLDPSSQGYMTPTKTIPVKTVTPAPTPEERNIQTKTLTSKSYTQPAKLDTPIDIEKARRHMEQPTKTVSTTEEYPQTPEEFHRYMKTNMPDLPTGVIQSPRTYTRDEWKTTTLTGQVYEATKHPVQKRLEQSSWLFSAKEQQEMLKGSGVSGRQGASAGLVATAESFVRPDIPTVGGALIGKYVFGREDDMTRLTELGPGYAVGNLSGEALLSYATGKVLGKVLQKPVSKIKSKYGQWRHDRYVGKVADQVEQWGDDIFMQPAAYEFSEGTKKIYKWTGYPTLHREPFSVIQVSKTKLSAMEQLYRRIELGQIPWSGQHPNLLPVFSKPVVDMAEITAKSSAFQGFSYTTKSVVMGASEKFFLGAGASVIGKAGTFLQPTVKEREIYKPELKPLGDKAEKEDVIPVQTPKIPSFTDTRIKDPKQRIDPKVKTVQDQVYNPISILDPVQVQEQQQTPIAVFEQLYKQKQVSKGGLLQKNMPPQQVFVEPPTPKPFRYFKRKKGKKGKKSKDWGLWFVKQYPVATPEQWFRRMV